jgi:soluble lytic murein transglycosylase-like protein
VTNPYDPAQNIMAGTRYLKFLLDLFGNRVDLVLAAYNAGEGAVMKHGNKVPPYSETREYVRTISKQYAKNGKAVL